MTARPVLVFAPAPLLTALRVGAACGALNVARSGLRTGRRAPVAELAKRIEIHGRRDGD